jgi:hypothetical protein
MYNLDFLQSDNSAATITTTVDSLSFLNLHITLSKQQNKSLFFRRFYQLIALHFELTGLYKYLWHVVTRDSLVTFEEMTILMTLLPLLLLHYFYCFFFYYYYCCLFVSLGVRGKPRVYCSLLAYCTARFGRSNFGQQMPPHYRRVPHSSGGSWD